MSLIGLLRALDGMSQNQSIDIPSAIKVLKLIQDDIHETAKNKGWWDDHERMTHIDWVGKDFDKDFPDLMFKMARIMLVVSELSEAVEHLRKSESDDMLPQFDGFTLELADVLIRIFDMCGRFKLPIAEALLAKMEYNKGRSYLHGGKAI